MSYNIHHGNNIAVLKTYPDNHFDSIITDGPYGLKFLGKDWDTFKATKVTKSQVVKNLGSGMRMTTYQENLNYQEWCSEWASECLRVLKPGGYLLSFSAARLYHHMACGIEAAGFEIRDSIHWIYSSGFPKATKVNGHEGWKTALKPAHEPIVMARKPFKGTHKDNMDKWGVGALNIDESRIPYENEADLAVYVNNIKGPLERSTATKGDNIGMHEGKTGFKVQKGKVVMPQGGAKGWSRTEFGEKEATKFNTQDKEYYTPNTQGRFPSNVIGEVEEGYQKYFYNPKVSRKERHCGFEQLPEPEPFNSPEEMKKHPLWDPSIGTNSHRLMNKIRAHNKDPLAHIPAPFGQIQGAYVDGERMAKVADDTQYAAKGNNHPTVKPVALMKYLIKLVTSPNSKVLDPFMGSGSTGMACVELGHEFTGIELDKHYCEIAEKRIEGWSKLKSTELFVEE